MVLENVSVPEDSSVLKDESELLDGSVLVDDRETNAGSAEEIK